MPDLSTDPDSRIRACDGAGSGTVHGSTTGTSRWQMVAGAMGLVVVLWVGGDLYDIVTSGGPGGAGGPGVNVPAGQPSPPGGSGGDGGHTPPAGGHGGQQR